MSNKESMFNVMVAMAILLSAMVGKIESANCLATLTIQSPQTASAIQVMPLTEAMTILGYSNKMSIRFEVDSYLHIETGAGIDVGYDATATGEYGDVAESDYPAIEAQLAAYGVSGFVTSYAFLVLWDHDFLSTSLLATNGAQTYYFAWHPGATAANRAGKTFGPFITGGISDAYSPDDTTVYVFRVDLAAYTQLTASSTPICPATTATTIIRTTKSTTTTSSNPPPRNSATKLSSSSSDNWMLLIALLLATIAAHFAL